VLNYSTHTGGAVCGWSLHSVFYRSCRKRAWQHRRLAVGAAIDLIRRLNQWAARGRRPWRQAASGRVRWTEPSGRPRWKCRLRWLHHWTMKRTEVIPLFCAELSRFRT